MNLEGIKPLLAQFAVLISIHQNINVEKFENFCLYLLVHICILIFDKNENFTGKSNNPTWNDFLHANLTKELSDRIFSQPEEAPSKILKIKVLPEVSGVDASNLLIYQSLRSR